MRHSITHKPVQNILSHYIKATKLNCFTQILYLLIRKLIKQFSAKIVDKNMVFLAKSGKASSAFIRPQCTVTNFCRELHGKKLGKCKFEEKNSTRY